MLKDLVELRLVRMFGIAAVYGPGPIPMIVLKRLKMLEDLSAVWESKNGSKDWATWIEQNPDSEELIQWSIVLAEKRRMTSS